MLVSPVASASNTQTIQPPQPPRPQMTEVAKLLGLSASELTSELQAGKTLDELASKKGVSSSELIKTIEGELTAHKPEGAPALSPTQHGVWCWAVAGCVAGRCVTRARLVSQ